MDIAFHTATSQSHQLEHFQWFRDGFKQLGINLRILDIYGDADYHIISGPNFAYQEWLGKPNVLMIDRALWHPEKSGKWQSMDWISIGWLQPDGTRIFAKGDGRSGPEVATRKIGNGTIYLKDYNDHREEEADTVRYHPAERNSTETLDQALDKHGIAIGYKTSALVTAALRGLKVICKDKRNIMSDPNWLEILPYTDWHYSEIQSGEALKCLWSSLK